MLLGPFRIFRGGTPLDGLPLKASALLAFLAMQDEAVSREKLAELLWPDRGSEQSRQSLRQATFSIRHAFGDVADDIIKKNPAGTAISLSGAWVDAHCLEHPDDTEELDDLASKAKYCAREFLAGFPSVSNPFDEWVLLQRSRLGSAAACLLRKLASLQMQHSDFDEAIGTAKQLVALDPLRENFSSSFNGHVCQGWPKVGGFAAV